MTIQTGKLTDPAVRAFVNAVNDGDQEAFLKILTSDATMADDGSDRDVAQWIDREIFSPGVTWTSSTSRTTATTSS